MDASLEPEITVPEPLPKRAIHRRHEPRRRQRHDENSRRTNGATDHDHAISGKALRQCSDRGHEEND